MARSDTGREQIEQEARILALFDHPNVVQLFDTALSSAPPFIVIQYLPGNSLDMLIEKRAQELHEESTVVHVLLDLLSAVAHVHGKGIVHRDIKPANVIWLDAPSSPTSSSKGKSRGTIKLVNFGIAKALSDSEHASVNVATDTAGDGMPGTPAYMGKLAVIGKLDPRIDLWSTGVTALELLLVETPKDLTLSGFTEELAAKLRANGCSHSLLNVLNRVLQQDPNRGFQTAGDFLAQLEPLQAAPPKAVEDKFGQTPTYWGKRGEYDLRRLVRSNPQDAHVLSALELAVQTDRAGDLGVGRDLHDQYKSGGRPTLVRAWRVENPLLWSQYSLAKEKVRKEVKGWPIPAVDIRGRFAQASQGLPGGGSLEKELNEVYLMHTPSLGVLLGIVDGGFDERFAGSNCGTSYGAGTYFAEDSAKTDQYARCDLTYGAGDNRGLHRKLYSASYSHPGDVFYVLVCRVVLGHYIETTSTAQVQPGVFSLDGRNRRQLAAIPGSNPPRPYHSLLGTAYPRFREFVSFNSNYLYPEYLIAYQ
eukprot:g2752.t1